MSDTQMVGLTLAVFGIMVFFITPLPYCFGWLLLGCLGGWLLR